MLDKLKGHVPDSVIAQIPGIAELTTPMRLAHFLSQDDHESGGFKRTVENLNYSDVNRIALIFKHDCDLDHDRVIEPDELEAAKKYIKNPQALANFVYANQNGNGNEASGDGFKFRGRGFIQLTGRDNYTAFSEFIGEDCVVNPDLVATKYPLASAGWFFTKNKIWAICDSGINYVAITAVTKKVNGGTNGLAERTALFNQYWGLLKA
ncbi:MAG: glycoside hydrolase family 19 protein [Methylobacter sp.]|jgi:putative chitinase|nr:glycoside hydrolase family 19 protein [Methylobacter sp.]